MGWWGKLVGILFDAVDVAFGPEYVCQRIRKVIEEWLAVNLQKCQRSEKTDRQYRHDGKQDTVERRPCERYHAHSSGNKQKLLERQRPDNLCLRLKKLWYLEFHPVRSERAI